MTPSMYAYRHDPDTGGLLLHDGSMAFSREPRPVYAPELDLLGFGRLWRYDPQSDIPYMWAEAEKYWYRGLLVARTVGGSLREAPRLEAVLDDGGRPVLPEGETLRPADIPAMVERNRALLNVVEQDAVKRIFDVYRRRRARLDGFHVAFSGGKDSMVLLDLVRRALPADAFVVLFGDTGMEFPDTYAAVDRVEALCRDAGISFHRAASHLRPEESWRIFGPPSRVLRWCCSVHKSAPQTLKLREIFGRPDFVGLDFVGVRAHESARRAGYEHEAYGMKQRGQFSCNPILEWTSAEVWLYMYAHNLVINEAYKKGNSRVGCLFCPLSSDKSNSIQYSMHGKLIEKYIDIIREKINDKNIDGYIENGGWIARKNGRDIKKNCMRYHENVDDDNFIIEISKPLSSWKEWIKTIDQLPFSYSVEKKDDGYIFRTDKNILNTQYAKKIKAVFHKATYCINCGTCEANCKTGAISFKNGLFIDNCICCGICHDIYTGCLAYHNLRLPKNGEISVGSINTFANHAPKEEWIHCFFNDPENFFENNSLGNVQMKMFKRFLSDSNLLKMNKPTKFFEVIKKIGWKNDFSWGLILVCLANKNSQILWYLKNLECEKTYDRKNVEKMLLDYGVGKNNTTSIVNAFKRLCFLPLGTRMNFGAVGLKNGKIISLTRYKTTLSDDRVVLFSLYKFAELCDNYYQFTLSRLMDNSVESAGVSPSLIFGFDREDMERILNGLGVAYPDFISVTFTHDLDKISLRKEKSSDDVLALFAQAG